MCALLCARPLYTYTPVVVRGDGLHTRATRDVYKFTRAYTPTATHLHLLYLLLFAPSLESCYTAVMYKSLEGRIRVYMCIRSRAYNPLDTGINSRCNCTAQQRERISFLETDKKKGRWQKEGIIRYTPNYTLLYIRRQCWKAPLQESGIYKLSTLVYTYKCGCINIDAFTFCNISSRPKIMLIMLINCSCIGKEISPV